MSVFLKNCNWIAPDAEINLKKSAFQWLVTLNPLIYQSTDQSVLKQADYYLLDGIGMQFALWCLGVSAKRCAGIDWLDSFLAKAAPLRVALIGATSNINEKAVKIFHQRFPQHTCVFHHHGFFQEPKSIITELKKIAPDLLLVAMGTPQQEVFLKCCKEELNSGLGIGVGGTFDVWAGAVKRAPAICQQYGLEWIYRMIKQPVRMKSLLPLIRFLIQVILKRS